MASRDLTMLSDSLQKKELLLRTKAKEKNIKYTITCTARSYLEQEALYAQGRRTLSDINALRKKAGLPNITQSEANSKVTWTMNSKHITGLIRTKSDAFDLVITDGTHVLWDIKVDTNKNKLSDYEELGKLAKECGIKWGGTFSTPDYPHFEDM